jgi:hypothetical protein
MMTFENSEDKPFVDPENGMICQNKGPGLFSDHGPGPPIILNSTCNGLGRIIYSNETHEG